MMIWEFIHRAIRNLAELALATLKLMGVNLIILEYLLAMKASYLNRGKKILQRSKDVHKYWVLLLAARALVCLDQFIVDALLAHVPLAVLLIALKWASD